MHDLRAQQDTALEEIVVSVTPVRSTSGLTEDKIAYNIQSAVAENIESIIFQTDRSRHRAA